MNTLTAFDETDKRIKDFGKSKIANFYDSNPISRGIVHSLVLMQWEGTASILSDALIFESNDKRTFENTIKRLGYTVENKTIHHVSEINKEELPCFISIDNFNAILLDIDDETAFLYDYRHDIVINKDLDKINADICTISHYSKLFREAPPQSQDKSNWVKYCFYKYSKEIRSLVWLSFFINLLGVLPPFYIMSVYNFTLTSQSTPTLMWLTGGALIVAGLEFFYKKMRMQIITSSGKELSVFISYNVLSKLCWLPYSITSNAGVASQLARLKDIDQIRSMATSSSTANYFDLPFIVIFLIAIFAIAGSVAISLLVGIIVMLGFCYFSRIIYHKVTTQSSRANALVTYQWNDLISNLSSVQGLPILRVIQSRFKSAHEQSTKDSDIVNHTNSSIQRIGQALLQIIGATTIVITVFMTMDGETNAGAMIAVIILVWKVLTPIMGIYNALIKFQTLKNSTKQINHLMSIDDNKNKIEKSTPINQINGKLVLKDLTQRYPDSLTGLTQLNFKIEPGENIAITGPSGSGKTTLLNIMSGIMDKYQGAVFCDGYNIKQFNNYCYRNAIKYIPTDLHFFQGTFADNIRLYNGSITDEDIEDLAKRFNISKYLGDDGINKIIDNEFLISLPNGIKQLMRLCVGLGNLEQGLILIDEPLLGVSKDYEKIFTSYFNDKNQEKTLIYTTNDKNLITYADKCLMLDATGTQKYFGFPDKVLQII